MPLLVLTVQVNCCSGPVVRNVVVRARDGALMGELVSGEGGTTPYFAFRGIPYAAPPLKDLRFKVQYEDRGAA